MKTLLLLRHAKSSWKNMNLTDFERPLNKRGVRDAPRMGKLLRRENLVPELIITSSAERALATAESVALASGYEGELEPTRRLYHADPDTYIEVLQEVQEEYARVMVVGHNPGMEDLLEDLTEAWEKMSTGAVAVIRLPIDDWGDLTNETPGELVSIWRPKELPASV